MAAKKPNKKDDEFDEMLQYEVEKSITEVVQDELAEEREFMDVDVVQEPIPEEPDPVQEEKMKVEKELHTSHGTPDFEKIAKVLYIYLEEIDKADREHHRESKIVHGLARNVAAKRLKWGKRVNGAIEWKV